MTGKGQQRGVTKLQHKGISKGQKGLGFGGVCFVLKL